VAIARLRRSLAPLEPGVAIESMAGGYRLRVRPGAVDADVFARHLAEAREGLAAGEAGRAAEAVRSALSLWRGPPLAEVAHRTCAQPAIALLEEMHLAALEIRIDADLRLGADGAVIERTPCPDSDVPGARASRRS
jgi:Bacterial transcriptional activator domain